MLLPIKYMSINRKLTETQPNIMGGDILTGESTAYKLYCLGMECFERGEYQNAISYFSDSYLDNPHFKTCERLYRCFKEIGNMTEVIAFLEKAYNLNSKNDKVAVQYAEELLLAHEIDKSEDILKNVLQRNSSYRPAKQLKKRLINYTKVRVNGTALTEKF